MNKRRSDRKQNARMFGFARKRNKRFGNFAQKAFLQKKIRARAAGKRKFREYHTFGAVLLAFLNGKGERIGV